MKRSIDKCLELDNNENQFNTKYLKESESKRSPSHQFFATHNRLAPAVTAGTLVSPPDRVLTQDTRMREEHPVHVFHPDFDEKFIVSNNIKKIYSHETHMIHSIASLKTLLDTKKAQHEKPDLRFLVDITNQARFARESHGDIPAPAHFQMTGMPQDSARCRTAGNFKFSEDYKTLIEISNKSGDFKPPFDSLKWIFSILIINEASLPFALPETLLVKEFSNSSLIRVRKWQVAQIREWVKRYVEPFAIASQLLDQKLPAKEVIYHPKAEDLITLPSVKFSFFELDEDSSPSDSTLLPVLT